MPRNASLFLARRYLRPRWSFVSVITFLSILGPVLGVAVLVVVTAVMNGFGEELRRKIFDMQAHLVIVPPQLALKRGEMPTIENPLPMLETLAGHGYRAAAVVEGPVLIQTQDGDITAKIVKGIEPAPGQTLTQLHTGMTVKGSTTLEPGQAIVGSDLAAELGLHVGRKLIIHPTGRLKKMIQTDPDTGEIRIVEPTEKYLPEEVEIVGIFTMGMYDYDANFILTSLDTADDFFLLDWGAATGVQIWTANAFDLDPAIAFIQDNPVFAGTYLRTWHQINRQLFQALQVEKTMLFVLLFFIVVVAAFCIAATLITVVIQKTREIGVLKAVGATPVTILNVFLLQGAIVGLLGAGLGTALGLLLIRYRQVLLDWLASIGIDVFPRRLYLFSELPAQVARSDLAIIVVGSFLICVVAALLPAVFAATRTPTSALHET